MKFASYQFTEESLESIDKSLKRIADSLEKLLNEENSKRN